VILPVRSSASWLCPPLPTARIAPSLPRSRAEQFPASAADHHPLPLSRRSRLTLTSRPALYPHPFASPRHAASPCAPLSPPPRVAAVHHPLSTGRSHLSLTPPRQERLPDASPTRPTSPRPGGRACGSCGRTGTHFLGPPKFVRSPLQLTLLAQ
jgi:hypothetical protein